jgi:hypothetical protein
MVITTLTLTAGPASPLAGVAAEISFRLLWVKVRIVSDSGGRL